MMVILKTSSHLITNIIDLCSFNVIQLRSDPRGSDLSPDVGSERLTSQNVSDVSDLIDERHASRRKHSPAQTVPTHTHTLVLTAKSGQCFQNP